MPNVSAVATVAASFFIMAGYCWADPEVPGAPATSVTTGVAQAADGSTSRPGSPFRVVQQAPPPQQKAAIRMIRITGVTVFRVEELHALVASGEGKELALAEIEQLAARITAHYRRHGYLVARAYVPQQQVQDGVVEIAVLEGRIGKIVVQGAKHYSPERIKAYVAPPPDQPVFRAEQLESGMLRLNDLPGLRVESTLRPGAEIGTTDIVLNVVKDRLVTGTLETNNYGSRLTGRYRFGASLDLNNPTGLGDVLSVRGVASEEITDTWFARAAYTLTMNTLGTKAGAAYTHAESVVGREFASLGINGTGDLVSVFVAHPFLRRQAASVFGQIGFDYKSLETRLLRTTLAEDTLSVFNAGGSFEAVDGWRGLTSGGVSFQLGVPGFLGSLEARDDPKASRTGAGGSFFKTVGSLSRLQQIYGPTTLFARATGQWTDDRLVSPEQFIAGGAGIVRGYPVAEISGDQGYTLTGEFRWNAPGFAGASAWGGKTWGDLVQLYGFVDYGEVRVLAPLPGQARSRDIASVGAGIRFGFPNLFHLNIEYANPMGPRPSDKVDEFVYFQATLWF